MSVNTKKIEVVPYNSQWPRLFEAEAERIKQILSNNCMQIHHVGSTAVPGLSAKPKIDIIAVVKDTTACVPGLEAIGYIYRGEYNLPFHHGFSKREGTSVNLHVFEAGNPEIQLNILFRDYLRATPEARAEYNALKMRLLQQKSSHEKRNSQFTGYNLRKNDFIQNILRLANFEGCCLRFCTHYKEWEAYQRIGKETMPPNKDNHYHFVLYQGVNIVAAAHIMFLNISEAVILFLATDEQRYEIYMLSLLDKWVESQGRVIKPR